MFRRPALAALAIGALVLVVLVVATRALPPIVTNSDLAIAEVYTELASRGQLIAGPYSRFGWNHPGPMFFYIVAPVYAAADQNASALFVAALAINLAAILAIAWVVSRDGRGPLAVFVTLACLLLAWRMPRLLASPWTAHVPVLSSLAFVTVCGAVAAGRYRMLPWLILVGSFIAQTHVSYVPMVGVLASVAVAVVILQERGRARGILVVSAGLWILLWLPALIEASVHRGGNLAELWRFFLADAGPPHTWSDSFSAWSYGLTGVLRADLGLPWGGHFTIQPSWWKALVAIGQVIALGIVAWHGLAAGRRIEAGVAGFAALASLVGLWSLTRIRGDFLDHELLGMVAIGALNLAVIASAAIRAFLPGFFQWRPPITAGAYATAIALCLLVGVQHFIDFTSYERRRSDTARIPATSDLLRKYFEQRGIERPVFQMDGDAAGDGAGIILRLLQAGWPVTVEGENAAMFPPALAGSGREDALVNLSSREGTHLAIAARPGNVILRDRHPLFVDLVVMRPKAF